MQKTWLIWVLALVLAWSAAASGETAVDLVGPLERGRKRRDAHPCTGEPIRFRGNEAVSDAEPSSLLAPMIGEELTIADLYTAAFAVALHYRNLGYFLAEANLPPQDVTEGVILIQIFEGRYVPEISFVPGNRLGTADLKVLRGRFRSRREVVRLSHQPAGGRGQYLEKRYGDEALDLTGIAMNVLSLAEGHTLADVGVTLYSPGKTDTVGTYFVYLPFDPRHEQAKNYILPNFPLLLAQVRVYPRKVWIDFGFIHIVKGYETLPERPRFLMLGAPDFVSEEDFRPYINISIPLWATGYGVYPLQFSLNGGEVFLSNYDLKLQGDVVLLEPDLQYMIEEGWKKAFSYEDPGARSLKVPGQEPGGPPALANFSSQSWPVVARAVGAFIMARDGKFSDDAFLELILAIKRRDPDVLGAVMPFLMDEFVSLLKKGDSELKPEEMAFLLDFLDSFNEQRAYAAAVAMHMYEEWMQEHRRQATGGNPLFEMFYIPPAPPDTFLQMALAGVVMDGAHEAAWQRTVTAMSSALGIGAAAGGAAAAVTSTGALKIVTDLVVPFAARAVAARTAAGVGAVAGGVAIGVAAIVTLGFAIDQVVKSFTYKGKMEDAHRFANTPLTLDHLRGFLIVNPDYLLAHFMIHVTRPSGLRTWPPSSNPWIID